MIDQPKPKPRIGPDRVRWCSQDCPLWGHNSNVQIPCNVTLGVVCLPWARQAAASHEAMEKGIKAVRELIEYSQGVYGLHLNGDEAPWDELQTGGEFENWLKDFDLADAILKAAEAAEAQKAAERAIRKEN